MTVPLGSSWTDDPDVQTDTPLDELWDENDAVSSKSGYLRRKRFPPRFVLRREVPVGYQALVLVGEIHVGTCTSCGALVDMAERDVHEVWHVSR